jgi:hypothetical protein
VVHKGKLWPVENGLRIFNLYETWPEWIPKVGLLTAGSWHHVGVDPGPITLAPTVGFDWTPGDEHYEFRTASVWAEVSVLQLGWQGRIRADHAAIETIIQCWVDNVPQFQFGGPNVFTLVTWGNWGPTFPGLNVTPGATIWPGTVGCEAQLWP